MTLSSTYPLTPHLLPTLPAEIVTPFLQEDIFLSFEVKKYLRGFSILALCALDANLLTPEDVAAITPLDPLPQLDKLVGKAQSRLNAIIDAEFRHGLSSMGLGCDLLPPISASLAFDSSSPESQLYPIPIIHTHANDTYYYTIQTLEKSPQPIQSAVIAALELIRQLFIDAAAPYDYLGRLPFFDEEIVLFLRECKKKGLFDSDEGLQKALARYKNEFAWSAPDSFSPESLIEEFHALHAEYAHFLEPSPFEEQIPKENHPWTILCSLKSRIELWEKTNNPLHHSIWVRFIPLVCETVLARFPTAKHMDEYIEAVRQIRQDYENNDDDNFVPLDTVFFIRDGSPGIDHAGEMLGCYIDENGAAPSLSLRFDDRFAVTEIVEILKNIAAGVGLLTTADHINHFMRRHLKKNA